MGNEQSAQMANQKQNSSRRSAGQMTNGNQDKKRNPNAATSGKGSNAKRQIKENKKRGTKRDKPGKQNLPVAPSGAVNPSGAPVNTEVVPFNQQEMSNQSITNMDTGILGTGYPINPDAQAIATAIKNNTLGINRIKLLNSAKKKNNKIKAIRLVNLACMDNKWKQYRSADWAFDIPVAPVNKALKSCVYTWRPEKPGLYDNLLGMNPATQYGAPTNPGALPLPEAMPITQENVSTPIQGDITAPASSPVQEMIPAPATQMEMAAQQQQLSVPPQETILVSPNSTPITAEQALVEKFMIGVDSNNQNMRYLMWITIILLIVVIIGFYYKSKGEKMIIKA